MSFLLRVAPDPLGLTRGPDPLGSLFCSFEVTVTSSHRTAFAGSIYKKGHPFGCKMSPQDLRLNGGFMGAGKEDSGIQLYI